MGAQGEICINLIDYTKQQSAYFAHIIVGVPKKIQIELNIEIDQAAELDSALFWKKVNSRRNIFCTNAGSEIKFGDSVCRDPESIVSGWGILQGFIFRHGAPPLRSAV